jgi:uncharacterized protein
MHPLFHPLYIEYCTYFNGNRDYFECHEVLEEYWKEIAPGERDHPLVGYIQVATGMYHWRRENYSGAERMLSKAFLIFKRSADSPFVEKIQLAKFMERITESIQLVQQNCVFQPFELEITDEKLKLIVSEKIQELLPVDHDFIVHKHMLRDRSDVISARAKSLAIKQHPFKNE